MGVLHIRHGHDVYVADDVAQAGLRRLDSALLLGRREPLNVVEARKTLEIQIAALAAERATASDLLCMSACLDRLRAATTARGVRGRPGLPHRAGSRCSERRFRATDPHLARTGGTHALAEPRAMRIVCARARADSAAVERREPDAAAMAVRGHFQETGQEAQAILSVPAVGAPTATGTGNGEPGRSGLMGSPRA
jgi:DNA-binding FadR family transcriptional regulator